MVKMKTRMARQAYSMRIDPQLLKQLKHLAVDEEKAVSELIEEAIRELIERHNRKTEQKASSGKGPGVKIQPEVAKKGLRPDDHTK